MNSLRTTVDEIFAELSSTDLDEDYSHRKKDLIQKKVQPFPREEQRRLLAEFFDFGPLSEIIEDTSVDEILVNRWDSVWCDRSGQLDLAHSHFLSPETYQQIFQRLCEETKLSLDLTQPLATARFREFRMSLVLPPVSEYPSLSLRRIRHHTLPLTELGRGGFLTELQQKTLERGLKEKKNLLFAGPTGSGKTTLMNAALQTLPSCERLVILEDADELSRATPSSVKLLTRWDPNRHLRSVDLSELVRWSLRLRPDRIIVGEVRGSEAKDLLLALSTGHRGSCCTLHASSPQEALTRLELLVQMGAPQWSPSSIRSLIRLGIDWIVQVHRREDGARCVEGIYSLEGLEQTGFLIERLDDLPLYA